jgi:hypothetical protein
MTREEEIREASLETKIPDLSKQVIYGLGFIDGAKFADKTMIERVLKFIFEYFYEHPLTCRHICTDSFKSFEELKEELIKVMEE